MWPFKRHAAFDVRSSRPFWLLRDGMGDAGQPPDRDVDCDVAIIGAGICGALIADALVAPGPAGERHRVVMLDQDEPGQGSTAASTALIQYEIDTHLVDLMELVGAERATQAYQACVRSFALLERRFPELLASSDYQRRESVYLAARASDVDKLQLEMAARQAIGIRVQWLDEAGLRRRYGCRRPGALVSGLAANVDPLRFTRGVLAGCRRHGVQVYSRSRVASVEPGAEHVALRMANGHSVRAQYVVVAAGYESLRFIDEPVAAIDNTFALVTEPVPGTRGSALPQIWETARPYLYLRGTPDGRILLGGGDLPFKDAQARELLLPRQIQKLRRAYEDLFGEALPPVAFTWAGSFGRTPDGLPYIGAVPGKDPRLLYALCFGGNGITYAVHSGDMIRAAIEGRAHELDAVFGFGRQVAQPARSHSGRQTTEKLSGS